MSIGNTMATALLRSPLHLRAYLERFPSTTPGGRPKFFGARWEPSDAELRETAEPTVFVAVDLGA